MCGQWDNNKVSAWDVTAKHTAYWGKHMRTKNECVLLWYSNSRVGATSLSAALAVFVPRGSAVHMLPQEFNTGLWSLCRLQETWLWQHTHTQTPWKPLKASLFSAACLLYYLIHYSICIIDKISNPKTSAGTLSSYFSIVWEWISSKWKPCMGLTQECFTRKERCFHFALELLDSRRLPFL